MRPRDAADAGLERLIRRPAALDAVEHDVGEHVGVHQTQTARQTLNRREVAYRRSRLDGKPQVAVAHATSTEIGHD